MYKSFKKYNLATLFFFFVQDVEQWQKLSSLIGQSCYLIADAAYRPCLHSNGGKPRPPGVTWVTLRHRSEMTLTDLLHAVTEQTGSHYFCFQITAHSMHVLLFLTFL